MKVEFPDADGGNVISLEVARKRMFKGDGCRHLSITVDRAETMLTCNGCGHQVNPVEWVASMIEEWCRVRNLIDQYKRLLARYEAKQRTRCEHCNKITRVNPATPAEVRKMERAAKQDEGAKL